MEGMGLVRAAGSRFLKMDGCEELGQSLPFLSFHTRLAYQVSEQIYQNAHCVMSLGRLRYELLLTRHQDRPVCDASAHFQNS